MNKGATTEEGDARVIVPEERLGWTLRGREGLQLVQGFPVRNTDGVSLRCTRAWPGVL